MFWLVSILSPKFCRCAQSDENQCLLQVKCLEFLPVLLRKWNKIFWRRVFYDLTHKKKKKAHESEQTQTRGGDFASVATTLELNHIFGN